MINFILRAVLYCSLLLLASCMQHISSSQEKSTFAACAMTCKSRANVCHQTCRNDCQHCCSYSNQVAAKKYKRYLHEQCVKGEFIALQLNSFRDPLQCRKTTCNCRADYEVCIQSCSGVIHKSLRVAPICP